jgi:PTH1 family peptidyl-tRNA hydrolase
LAALQLIAGLGNIGSKYEGTRHNVGLDVVRRVAQLLKARPLPSHEYFESVEADTPGEDDKSHRIVLAIPTTHMNRSGLAIRELLEQQSITPNKMLVVVDDVDLPLGTLRFRADGSDGGHRGLRSIIMQLEIEAFPRLRLGVGRPGENEDTADYVLSRFRPEEADKVERMIALAAEAVIFAATHRFEEAMSQFNRNPALPNPE